MANAVDLHLNINNALEKSLERSNVHMRSINDKLSVSDKLAMKLSGGFGTASNFASNIGGSLSKIKNSLQDMLPAFGVIFGGGMIINAAREFFELDKNVLNASTRMGEAAASGTELKGVIASISKETGLSIDNIEEMIVGLTELRMSSKDIGILGSMTANFARVTGLGSDNTAELVGNLSRMSKISASGIKNMLGDMFMLQNQLGLTSNEMNSVSTAATTISRRMSQLGKSESEIRKMTKGTTVLVAEMSKIGVEASVAIDLVTDLFDPDRVEENMFLYSKLGISMQDAFSGNVDIIGQMGPKLRELGLEITNMSGPAASAMARELGLSLDTLRQFAKIDPSLGLEETSKVMSLIKEEGLSQEEALKKVKEETTGVNESFSNAFNKIKGIGLELMNKLSPVFTAIADKAESFAASEGFEKLKNSIGNFITGFKDFIKFIPVIGVGLFLIFKKVRRRLYSTFSEGIRESLIEGISEGSRMGVEKNKALVEKMFDGTSPKYSETLLSDERHERINRQLSERINIQESLRKASIQGYEAEVQSNKDLLSKAVKRIDAITKKGEKATAIEKMELAGLENARAKTEEKINIANSKKGIEESRLTKQKSRNLKFLSDEELRNIGIAAKSESEHTIATMRELEKKLTVENQNFLAAQKSLEEIRKSEEDNGQLTLEQLKQKRTLTDVVKQSSDAQEEIRKILEDQEVSLAKQNAAYEKINSAIENRGVPDAPEVRETMGIGAKFGHAIKDSFLSITQSVSNTLHNAGYRVADGIRAAGEALKPKNLGKTLWTGLKKGGSFIGSQIKGSLKNIVGPMAIMGLAMKLLGPTIEALQPVIQILTDIFQSLMGTLLKALLPPFLKILAALFPVLVFLVNTILPPILTALGYLLKGIGGLLKFFGAKSLGQSLKDSGNELVEDFGKMQKIISKDEQDAIVSGLNTTADRIANGEIGLVIKKDKTGYSGVEFTATKDNKLAVRTSAGEVVSDQTIERQEDLTKFELRDNWNKGILSFEEYIEGLKKEGLAEIESRNNRIKGVLSPEEYMEEQKKSNMSGLEIIQSYPTLDNFSNFIQELPNYQDLPNISNVLTNIQDLPNTPNVLTNFIHDFSNFIQDIPNIPNVLTDLIQTTPKGSGIDLVNDYLGVDTTVWNPYSPPPRPRGTDFRSAGSPRSFAESPEIALPSEANFQGLFERYHDVSDDFIDHQGLFERYYTQLETNSGFFSRALNFLEDSVKKGLEFLNFSTELTEGSSNSSTPEIKEREIIVPGYSESYEAALKSFVENADANLVRTAETLGLVVTVIEELDETIKQGSIQTGFGLTKAQLGLLNSQIAKNGGIMQ